MTKDWNGVIVSFDVEEGDGDDGGGMVMLTIMSR